MDGWCSIHLTDISQYGGSHRFWRIAGFKSQLLGESGGEDIDCHLKSHFDECLFREKQALVSFKTRKSTLRSLNSGSTVAFFDSIHHLHFLSFDSLTHSTIHPFHDYSSESHASRLFAVMAKELRVSNRTKSARILVRYQLREIERKSIKIIRACLDSLMHAGKQAPRLFLLHH